MSENWKVYVHTNKSNGKRYVGITSKKNVNQRWNSGRGYTKCPRFYSAIIKYGWDGFEHEVIADGLTESEAISMERLLISEWNTNDLSCGYNLTLGGEGTPGYFPSIETREKKRIKSLRENLSPETLIRRSEALRGRKFSAEHKRKIGDANSKPIKMFSKDGVLLNTFSSATEAECSLGILHSHISQCCTGKRQTTGGYKWSFA